MEPTAINTDTLRAFRDGNETAFKTVYDQFYARVFAMAKRYTSNPADAQDITAEAFIKLWKERAAVNKDTDLASFLRVNVKYKCIEAIRKAGLRQKHHQALLDILEHPGADDFATEQVRLELVKKIYAAAENLAPKIREVFDLSYKKGLKPAEIAGLTGTSVQTVKNQRVRAIVLLRKNFAGEPLILALLWLMEK